MTERVWFIVLDCNGIRIKDEWGNNEPDKGDLAYTERHYKERHGGNPVVINVFSVPRG